MSSLQTLLLNRNGVPVLTRPYGEELTRLLCDADYVRVQSAQFNEAFRADYTVEAWDTDSLAHPLDMAGELLGQLF